MKLAVSIVLMSSLCVLPLCSCDSRQTNDSGTSRNDSSKAVKGLTLDLGKGVTMKLALIPAGKFLMGSPPGESDRNDEEGPQHEVTISKPFYMGIHEVTQEQYKAVMGANPSYIKGASNPVELVIWEDAVEFCNKLSAKTGKTVRLPTEAEWEYACRAGTTTPFHTGETISTDEANYDGSYVYGSGRKGKDRQKTVPVGSFKPNAFGLYDMHGNVWEWCSDWYDKNYYRKAPRVDPQGPVSGSRRVLRGGSESDLPRDCRSAFRGWYLPLPGPRLGDLTGFRVAVVSSGREGMDLPFAGSDEQSKAAPA